jgi:hypothetical protein
MPRKGNPMQHHRTNTPARVPPVLIVITAVLALVIIGAIIGFAIWQWVLLDQQLPGFVRAVRVAFILIVISLMGWAGAVGLVILWRRWGWRASVFADKEIALMKAKVQIAPLATSYQVTNALPPPADMLQLEAPIDVVKELDQWMRWQDEQPHTLLAGRTKAGKTHLATAILERRLRAQERVFVIDPHSSSWLNLPTAGSVANASELKFALVALLSEYARRMEMRENFKKAHNGAELPHDHFGRMTIDDPDR